MKKVAAGCSAGRSVVFESADAKGPYPSMAPLILT